ncbi:MAG: tetraacyldisaccharide 4'-kinase [Pseudomonadota bacterium]
MNKNKIITTVWQSYNCLSLSLWPLSKVYCFVIQIRKFCYQINCFKTQSFSAPVIVVGNITVGGNGKTPLIIQLLSEFKNRGFNPGVVSRGYAGTHPLLAQGETIAVDTSDKALLYGDEAWMIANKTQFPVVVGRNRAMAVAHLIKDFGCDMVLSDDGLQHYAMVRDIEICVVDNSKKFGNGFCLPAGPLREPVSRLKQVDYIVNHQTSAEGSDKQGITMHLEFDQLLALNSRDPSATLSDFKNKSVHAIAGIANPARFFNQLRQNGINVIEHGFADHYQFQPSDFEFKDNYPVLMTEKDAVKCINFKLANCYYISVKATLSADLVKSIIAKLKIKGR